ncbi:hypothetical protein FA13DRAFT_83161 [Coprinellus micaceus]|uniref:F-box domain-containing protein n=1 Tax=Coprinellus micaceus TaxID=71717 RepID=A0A4Y7SBW3_COPMI|nr:hypothetical protein FA13DRAFT_489682 [Coprinellus micaceus]TEB34372.1 hypothetical protein FA13DRAFT_83161 [Coprinellus micaceus]
MQGLSQTLRVLKLFYTPLEFFRDDIISSNLRFPLLEEFHFNFFTIFRTTDYEDISQKCIAPFINSHSQTLKKLSVANRGVSQQPEYYYEPRRLFEHLTHLPGLAHLSVRLFLLLSDEASLDQLGRFIHAHSGSLSLLELHLYHSNIRPPITMGIGGDPQHELGLADFAPTYSSQTLFAHHIFGQALSSCRGLKTLQCMFLSEEALQSDAAPFLLWFPTIKCADTLTNLFLLYNTLKQDDIIALISSVDLPGLRRLRVKVLAFNMTLFDALSSKLTGLQELTVWAFSLTCTLAAGIQVGWTPVCRLPEYSPFLRELRTRSYAHWESLRDFFIPMIDGGHQQHVTQLGCDMEASIWQSWISEEQVRVAFPQIRRFDGGIRPFEML